MKPQEGAMKVESLDNWKTISYSHRERKRKRGRGERRVQWTGDQPLYRQGDWVTYQA